VGTDGEENGSIGVPGWELQVRGENALTRSFGGGLVGVLRLRECFASRSIPFAQDDITLRLDFDPEELRHVAEFVVAGGDEFGNRHLQQLR
jgi:hypothetical protein